MQTPARLAVTFNDEIYTHHELRNELKNADHVFSSMSDTEVVLHAFALWGEKCTSHLQGRFAFCVCDFVDQRLFLVLDHAGIKPLFYRVGPHFVAFASKLSALRAIHAPPPRGSLQSVDFNGNIHTPHRWWRPHFDPAPQSQGEDILP